jgi:D-xylose transport system permease protein
VTESAVPPASAPEREQAPEQSLSAYMQEWWQGVKFGELGSLPLIVGLGIIVVTFGLLDDTFLTERNFTNLLLQTAAVATIAIGVVFVLLIGEIDLSVAFVSAVGGVVMTLLLRPDDPGWPWWLAILAALLVTTAIGFVQALVITKAGVPSFVVTLAGLLIWSGVVLILTTQASQVGTIRIQDQTVVRIANDFLSETAGWIVGAVAVLAYALAQLNTARQRRASGLYGKPFSLIVLQVAGLALVTFAAVWYCNQDRGVPYAILILIVFLIFWSFIAARTRFGRHVYAVGGNAEASRRASTSTGCASPSS